MELKECITCGSHSFTDNKCDYCGNEYEVQDDKHTMRTYSTDGISNYAEREIFYKNDFMTLTEKEGEEEKPEFVEAFEIANEHDRFFLKIMASILALIIWFAVCVFIPPLFLISICGGIIWVCRKICKKY